MLTHVRDGVSNFQGCGLAEHVVHLVVVESQHVRQREHRRAVAGEVSAAFPPHFEPLIFSPMHINPKSKFLAVAAMLRVKCNLAGYS